MKEGMWIMNKIYITGIGPGSKDYLLPITKRIVKQSDVLIGGKRALELFSKVDKEKIRITKNLNKIKNYIKNNCHIKKITVLVSGDPGFYSILSYLKRYFSREKLKVIPGISALQLGFAKTGSVWQDAKFVSLHGNNDKDKLLFEINNYRKVGLITDNSFPPHQIIDFMINNKIKEKRVVVAENLTYPSEKIIEGKLKELSKREFSGLAVMVISDDSLEI
jgi:cobalt-precorrin-7 (C5)-methyltransferase